MKSLLEAVAPKWCPGSGVPELGRSRPADGTFVDAARSNWVKPRNQFGGAGLMKQ